MHRRGVSGGSLGPRILKGAAVLLVVSALVAITWSSLPSESRECRESPYFGHAIEWLAPHLIQAASVNVCNVGPPLREATVPSELTCAVKNAHFVNRRKNCNVLYSDLTGLNSFQTNRQVEASALRIPSGALLLQKSLPHSVLTNRNREVSVRDRDSVYYATYGQPSMLDDQGPCKISCVVKPDEDDPRIYILMTSGDSIFFETAKKYATERGYGFLIPSESCQRKVASLPSSWRKIFYLRAAMTPKRRGWILWMDPNSLVTNMEYELEELTKGPVAKNALLMVGQDVQPPYLLNVGTLFAKSCPKSRELLESIWQCGLMKQWTGPDSFYWDQNAISHLVESGLRHKEFSFWLKSIRMLPQRVLGSFMRQDASSVQRDIGNCHWRPGDFAALISGIGNEEAERQAKDVLSIGKNNQKLTWLGKRYHYPNPAPIPSLYSVRLDSYFDCEKPTWLHFKTEAPNRHTLNPSCVWSGPGDLYERVWCVVRTINYNLDLESGFYQWPEVGKTINQFFELSAAQYLESPGKTIEIESTEEMFVPVNILGKMYPGRTEGFEDVKMIRVGSKLVGIATCLQFRKVMACEITALTIERNKVISAVPLRGYKDGDCHKNWMPFLVDETLHLIEQPDPLVIIKPDIEKGRAEVAYESRSVLYPGLRLRGTSNGIQFGKDGFLFMIHETIQRGKEYAHRLMYVQSGSPWKRKLSRPFFVVRKTVEFVIGMQLSADGAKLNLGFGFQDLVAGFQAINIGSPDQFLSDPTFWMDAELKG